MKRLINLLNFGLLAVMTWGMVSCSNDLNGLTPGNGNGNQSALAPVAKPDAIVWSGNQTLLNTINGTRNSVSAPATRAIQETKDASQFEYKYFNEDQETKLSYAANPEKEPDYASAVEYKLEYQENGQPKQESGTYYVPAGEYKMEQVDQWNINPGIKFANNSEVKIFLRPGAKVEGIGSSLTKVTVFIAPGAELTINSPGSGDWYIYNGGKLNLPNALGVSNYKNIYNIGDVILGPEGNLWESTVNVYSKGGVVYVKTNDNAVFDLKGTLIADYLLHVDGNLKIESDGKRDICAIEATGEIEFTDGNAANQSEYNYAGQIIGKNIKFDGIKLRLHPDGLIKAEENITIGNSHCSIDEYEVGYKGVVRCKEFHLDNEPLTNVIGDGIYFDVVKLYSSKDGNDADPKDLLGEDRVNKYIDVTAGCVAKAGGSNGDVVETDPCPKKEEGHDCGHKGSIHNPDGTCPDCIKEGNEESKCYPEDPEDYCDECGHPGGHTPGEGPCDQCTNPEDPCYKDNSGDNGGNTGSGTQTPGGSNKYDNNEVEINFSLNDVHTVGNTNVPKYDIFDLVTKLSIHVRYPHDVEVIIPVPEKFYCDQDDLYILKDHSDGNYVYGGDQVEYEAVVAGETVTLGVEFVTGKEDNLTKEKGGYIRVWTDGINENVINTLQTTFGDGINFEIYNYFNRGTQYTTGSYEVIRYDELQYKYLSHTMVNFDWNANGDKEYPEFYINAFNQVKDEPVKGDCYVWILGDTHANNGVYLENGGSIKNDSNTPVVWGGSDFAKFKKPYQGKHYNGSPLNWIYTNGKIVGAEDSNDMPDAIWPFGDEFKQYYRFNGGTNWQATFNDDGF